MVKKHPIVETGDTISAVITALGEGAVGIVRISGNEAAAIGDKMFQSVSGKKLTEHASHLLVYGHVVDEANDKIDEVLAVYMRGPHSYTAEDVVEIQSHGGLQSLKTILGLTYNLGARPGEPGEFTKRDFLNGRIDLIQAEAVMDIIKSRSEAFLKMAVHQQDGQLSKKIKGLRRNLLDLVVNLEAVIDYPEDDIEEITFYTVSEGMEKVKQELEYLLQHVHTGKILREGLQTVIVGRPNVGKSSLLNALLSEERAIVSEYAGTTRDVIEEQLLLGSVPLVLVDTAGIRQTEDYVEQIGVARSKERLDKAELAVVVLDGSQPLTEEDEEILHAVEGKPCVIIVNKGDQPQVNDLAALQKRFGADRVLLLSAKTGGGLEQFMAWLQNYVYGSEHALAGGAYVQNVRHEKLLREALFSVEDAIRAAASMLPYDCIVIDLHKAIAAMGSITGDTLQDEIINEIFSKFCVGK
ncbi:MAG: tRNA uridine-5-carboxymethylaminomethyl(34) synthesis GTPase MnmE [Acidaminococcaceae bacterium]|nr:tRNA uridine-5-carboxymethylaminomethyl(34) synthesis GTPase MnmE [Acidaminococcaceae bacterium]